MWFLEPSSRYNRTWELTLVSNPHLQIIDKNIGALSRCHGLWWEQAKPSPCPFYCYDGWRWGRIISSCLLKSPPDAGGFVGATDGAIHGVATRGSSVLLVLKVHPAWNVY